ncbi:acetylcholinesterase-like isoform X3 [Phymastichus coffea]|uniref:acetylcholinesterase-like isoform X3 n=1 Tax=Phymastichus coffea TaxID=108790 RepID=UPI00273CF12B|nr:acetylcholinesterase-like isoform X3 [Phymastichus coffea]
MPGRANPDDKPSHRLPSSGCLLRVYSSDARTPASRGMAGVRVVPRWRLQQRHASNLGCFRVRHQAEGAGRDGGLPPEHPRVLHDHGLGGAGQLRHAGPDRGAGLGRQPHRQFRRDGEQRGDLRAQRRGHQRGPAHDESAEPRQVLQGHRHERRPHQLREDAPGRGGRGRAGRYSGARRHAIETRSPVGRLLRALPGRQVRSKFGCYRATADLVRCLRNVELKTLIQESAFIETWGPIVDADINNSTDGPFLPRHPRELAAEELYAVPLISGYTNNEQALAYIQSIGGESADGRLAMSQFEAMIREESGATVLAPDENSTCELRPELVAEAVLFYYRPQPPSGDQRLIRDQYLALQTEKNYAAGLTQLAAKVSAHPSGAQAFVYRFDYRSKTPAVVRDVPEWAGVPHLFEQPFVWGLPYAAGTAVQWNMADKKMADIVMSMLAGFGRTGNPSVNTIKWEPYEQSSPGILIVERNIDMNEAGVVDYKALAFWNDYYPVVLDAAVNNCCNATSLAGPRSPRAHGLGLAALAALGFAWRNLADHGLA